VTPRRQPGKRQRRGIHFEHAFHVPLAVEFVDATRNFCGTAASVLLGASSYFVVNAPVRLL
jgi:hypothetical protein